jgi:hypothetical protein
VQRRGREKERVEIEKQIEPAAVGDPTYVQTLQQNGEK